MRERVAGIIEEHGQVLMVQQRARGRAGRHDGQLYLTLPGGGVETGESPETALAREIAEEVGLTVLDSTFVARIDHVTSDDSTTVFRVWVAPGQPVLGVDPDIDCDCPRLVGIGWVPAPPPQAWARPGADSHLRITIDKPQASDLGVGLTPAGGSPPSH